MRDAGGDVIGLDWRIPLDRGWESVGEDRGVQGNLDRALLLGPWERVERATLDVLARAAGRPGHIFNLGHGVVPETDPAVLGRLRELVHEQTARVPRMSTAVVLMAYGSPDRLEDVPAYYADIRGGRPIAPENLEDLVERYRRLGIEESNPLNEITEATRAALEAELELPVFTGMRHWQPRIADAVEQRAGRRRRRDRRPRPRAPLLLDVDRPLPRAARRGARRPRASCASSTGGAAIPASSRCSPRR